MPRVTRRKGTRLFAAEGPRYWDVGARMGAALRAAYRREEEGASDGEDAHTSTRRRPHVRRAHWHTFLKGPRNGERQHELRWLPPIPVGVDDYDTLPVVIRKVY